MRVLRKRDPKRAIVAFIKKGERETIWLIIDMRRVLNQSSEGVITGFPMNNQSPFHEAGEKVKKGLPFR
jgi:hypothetical protein